jgi:putative aldouronate transport system permease protein
LVFGFPFPILLALMLNEIAFKQFKRVTQTILYMPHFLSWIIISGMAMQIFAPENGMINILLSRMGQQPIPFLSDTTLWVITYVGLGVWQSAGYNTIVYLAAITGINPELYEASEIDGAGRLRKILHVTLPGIRPTIVVMLILNLGRILNISFDRPYALGNFLVRDWSDVISTYVYRVGIQSQQFSLATAVGLFQSVVCVIFLVSANVISERMGERGIW